MISGGRNLNVRAPWICGPHEAETRFCVLCRNGVLLLFTNCDRKKHLLKKYTIVIFCCNSCLAVDSCFDWFQKHLNLTVKLEINVLAQSQSQVGCRLTGPLCHFGEGKKRRVQPHLSPMLSMPLLPSPPPAH